MEILAKARALIMPSRVYEGCPVVLAEAYARGVPVIGPRHGAFAEYIEDDETGRLFDPGDPVHLAECIRALQTSQTAERMGEGPAGSSSGASRRSSTAHSCSRSTVAPAVSRRKTVMSQGRCRPEATDPW